MAVSGGGGGGGQSIEAGKAHVSFSAQDAGLESYMSKIGGKVSKFGATVSGIGGGMMGLGASVLAPLAGLFTEAVGHFDNVQDAADRLGTSTESISRLGYAADLAGSNMGEVEAAARVMQKQLEKSPKAFEKLGLSAGQLKGLGLEDQFLLISEAISGLDEEARGTALMSIMGKGGAKLGPMLKDGAAALEDALAEADRVGDTVAGGDASNAAKTADAFDKSWKSVKNTLRAVGAAFLPLAGQIESGVGSFLEFTQGVREFINENRAGVQMVAAFAAAITVAGGAVLAAGGTIAAFGFAISSITGAVAGLAALVVSPFALITGAVVAATGALLYFGKTADGVGGSQSTLSALGETFSDTFNGVKDALEAGEWELAWEIMLDGLSLLWTQFIDGLFGSIERLWENIKLGWREVSADAALALGKTQDEASWTDKFEVLAREFNREVLGGADMAESGPLIRKDGKAALSDLDAHRAEAVKSYDEAMAGIGAAFDAAIDAINAGPQGEILRKKEALAAKRKAAADAAASARFGKYFDSLDWLAKSKDIAGGMEALYQSIGTGGTFRGTFGAESAAATAGIDKVVKNTEKTNDLLEDIREQVGGLPVE